MKKPLSYLALVTGAVLLALPLATAQSEPKGPPREGGKGGGGRGRGPSIEMLVEQLSLSKEQAEKLKPVLEAQRAKMEALRADESLSQDDRRARMRSIREEGDAAIGAVLTPEQKKKWEEARANRGPGGPGGERRGGGEGKGDAKGERPRP
jgi:Spy/CpxP family protein refolding chaperone